MANPEWSGVYPVPPEKLSGKAGPDVTKPGRLVAVSGLTMFFACLLLFGLVSGVFLPVIKNEFVNYDDTVYVTENTRVQRGLTWENLKWAVTTYHAANWHPLTWLSHMIDCELYGLDAAGHHLTSVVLHALNTALLFLALWQMTGASLRSLAVATLFGLHPLRVESVAWVAERKDLLSGLFFMLTLVTYAQYVRELRRSEVRAKLYYVLALVAFACGLMSKPMLVTVPFVLLLLDWWPLERITIQDLQLRRASSHLSGLGSMSLPIAALIREKAPFFLLAAAAGAVTLVAQHSGGSIIRALPLVARVENALVSYCRYLGKLFWPVDLAVYYPHPKTWPITVILICAAVLTVVSFFIVIIARRRPYPAVGWLWYLGMLVPVIGLVQVGTQSMADRYMYLPMIGLLVMIVWGIHDLAGRRRLGAVALCVVGVVAAAACAAQTTRQIKWWKNSETLFRRALAVTKENSVALNNLARALAEKGQFDDAMHLYHKALRLNASDPFAYSGLGVLLMKKHDYNGAAKYLQKALELDPNDALTHYNLGIILARRGMLDSAISHFERAVQLAPDHAEAHNNLGGALALRGRHNDAIPHYREAIRLKPDNALFHKNLGDALLQKGRLDDAIEALQQALRLQPNFAEAQEKLRTALEFKTNAGSLPTTPPNP